MQQFGAGGPGELALIVCALAACGTEFVPLDDRGPAGDAGAEGADDAVVVASDGDVGSVPDGAPGDGGPGVTPDGATALTPCEEATQHSDLAWLQQHVFTPSCAVAGCHAGTSPDVGLSLEAGKAYANLVNRGSSTVSGWIRVVPGQPAQSYLLVALGRAAGPPPRDGFMPIGGSPPLCVEMVEAVERWVWAGAPP